LGQQGLEPIVQPGIPSPVQFEIFEEQQKFFEMDRGQAIVDGPEGMGQDVGNMIFLQILRQVKDIFPGLLQVLMLFLINIVNQDVGLAAILREIGGHFLADKGVGEAGDFQAAVNDVVVRDGYQGHASLFGKAV
jgi:hypothetical protein